MSELFADRIGDMQASEIRELLKVLDEGDIISFAGGIPDPALFPTKRFSDAFSKVLSGSEAESGLQYSVSEGYAPLREWIAEDMQKAGVKCTVDNILITSGSQQALDYLGKLFLSEGDVALLQNPTYLGALQAFKPYQPVFQQTACSETMNEQAKFIYTVPDFANPTGETLNLFTAQ